MFQKTTLTHNKVYAHPCAYNSYKYLPNNRQSFLLVAQLNGLRDANYLRHNFIVMLIFCDILENVVWHMRLFPSMWCCCQCQHLGLSTCFPCLPSCHSFTHYTLTFQLSTHNTSNTRLIDCNSYMNITSILR